MVSGVDPGFFEGGGGGGGGANDGKGEWVVHPAENLSKTYDDAWIQEMR